METTGEIWYGPKDKKDECTQTGVTIPKYNETTVLITDYVKDGATLGWDIKVNDKSFSLEYPGCIAYYRF